MPGNKWWSTKIGPKFQSDFVMFLRLSSKIPLDFHDLTGVVPLKYLMLF